MRRLHTLALAAFLLGGCAQIPSVPSSEFVTVPVPVTDRYRITRMHAVTSPEACLTPDPTAEPMFGQNLPPGCANAYNLMRMTEHQEDLVRGRKLGAAPAGRDQGVVHPAKPRSRPVNDADLDRCGRIRIQPDNALCLSVCGRAERPPDHQSANSWSR
jgi:hypothetical protein